MKVLLIEHCDECPHYGEFAILNQKWCEKDLKRKESDFNEFNEIPEWCPLPDVTHVFGDLYHSNKLTKAIAQEALRSGAKFEGD